MRIPVRFSAHAADAAPYTIDEAFFQRVDWAIDQAQSRGLAAIVDLHHYEELMKAPDAHAARFLGLWRQIAALPPRPAGHRLSEPSTSRPTSSPPIGGTRCSPIALRVVRGIDLSREVIIDSTFWAAAKELAN